MKQNKSYPAWEPTCLSQISKQFIHQYFTVNLDKGTCSLDDVNAFRKEVKKAHETHPNKPMTAYATYRKWFAGKYYPSFLVEKKSKETDEEFFSSIGMKKASKTEE